MEGLEPWNMFTNDMIENDNSHSYTDNINGNGREITTMESSYLRTQLSKKPTTAASIRSVTSIADATSTAAATTATATAAVNNDNENDDTIFNFNVEPQVQVIETSRLRPSPAQVNRSFSSDTSDSNISFEIAVIYICPACGAEFDAQDAWKRHMNGLHSYNTRRGLNFIQVDKLYHECLECHKRIAMHSMENLLKHKFTHLPYRCTKCRVCLRQYKYRQDLMVHLRMLHRDDVKELTKTLKESTRLEYDNDSFTTSSVTSRGTNNNSSRFAIMDVKENAVDIFGSKYDDAIEVKNELIEPDDTGADDDDNDESNIDGNPDVDAEQTNSSFILPTFLEESISRDSSQGSDRLADEELCEKHIQYICPACCMEYGVQAQWRYHIENVHDFGTRKGLNFREVNMKQNAQCLECNKVIIINDIRHLQLHKFTHLPNKAWLRCKLCFRSCVGKKEIIKHLLNQHHISRNSAADDSQEPLAFMDDDDDDFDAPDDSAQSGHQQTIEERDVYEPNIEYLCPQCGKEFLEKKMWRKHIVRVHRLTDLQVLNFKIINDRQVVCLECNKIITNAYGVQNAQQHRITHMPFKSFIRCRLCAKSYTDRKGLVKHLRAVHRIGRKHTMSSLTPPLPSIQNSFTRTTFSSNQSYNSTKYGTLMQQKQQQQQQQQQHKQQQNQHQQQYIKTTQKRSQPQKEIVHHAGYTYEIKYLDDDDGDVTLDNKIVSELNFSNNFDQFSRYKCDDCGSIFTTKESLQSHIKREHEFLDYYNLKPITQTSAKNGANTTRNSSVNYDSFTNKSDQNSRQQNEDQSNDADDLLIPTGDEDVSSPSMQDTFNIERNFCYLCPACGVEFKMQNDWRRHINDVHNFDKRHFLNFRQIDKFRYQCTECGDIVCNSKLKGLQDHKFRHLSHKLYIKCLICGNCYNHKPNMISHLKTRHNIQDPTQPFVFETNELCNKKTPLRSTTSNVYSSTPLMKPPGVRTAEDSLSFHNAVDHESIIYCCPKCNESFDTHVFWRKHIVDEHKLNTRAGLNFRQIDHHHYLCLECYKRVTVTHTKGAIGQLQSHKFRHLPFKSFRCRACKSEFVRKQMFFKHLNRNTNQCDGYRPKNGDNFANIDLLPVSELIVPNAEAIPHPEGVSETLIVNQNTFTLLCPVCGQNFGAWHTWRQHISTLHQLDNRDELNFTQISPTMYECNECKVYVSGKLNDLQVHRYKHLPYGAFIQCKFCNGSFMKIGQMEGHLNVKHPNVVVTIDEYTIFEEMREYEEKNSPMMLDELPITHESDNQKMNDVDDDDDALKETDDNEISMIDDKNDKNEDNDDDNNNDEDDEQDVNDDEDNGVDDEDDGDVDADADDDVDDEIDETVGNDAIDDDIGDVGGVDDVDDDEQYLLG